MLITQKIVNGLGPSQSVEQGTKMPARCNAMGTLPDAALPSKVKCSPGNLSAGRAQRIQKAFP
jgi:ABC-type polar amino acid transport system ATPase subunit